MWSNDQQGRQRRITIIWKAQTLITLPHLNHPRPSWPLRRSPIFPRHLQLQKENIHDKANKGHLPLLSSWYTKSPKLVSSFHLTTNTGLYGANQHNWFRNTIIRVGHKNHRIRCRPYCRRRDVHYINRWCQDLIHRWLFMWRRQIYYESWNTPVQCRHLDSGKHLWY